MLTVKFIEENKDEVIERLRVKQFKGIELISQLLDLDSKRRAIQSHNDNIKAELNVLSKEIGMYIQHGQPAEAQQAKQKTALLKEESKHLDEDLKSTENQLKSLLEQIPN